MPDYSRLTRFLLLVALGAVMTPAAWALNINAPNASSWTVYAFGNAHALSDAFRALNNFSASSTFNSLATLLAVTGIIVVGLSSGFGAIQPKRLVAYFMGVALLGYVLFGSGSQGPLTVNVEVIDSADATWVAPVTVPAIIGIPASMISTAGHEITRQIEASFPIPDEMKMSNGAPFNLAAAMLSDAAQAKITDPNLSSSLAYYVQDCFSIGVVSGGLSADVLLNSTNFLYDMRYPHPGVMVNTLLHAPEGSSYVVNCDEAWNLINTKVASYGQASDMLKNASAWARTPALSVVNAAADATAQWATNGGVTNGASLIKQSAMISAFKGAYRQTAAATGNSDFLTGLAMAQAQETQVTGWLTSAEVFNRTMGYIFAVLQVFIYAITPLMLVATFIPGLGLAMLKNFGQVLLWLALWQPMLAVVNFVILSMQQADLGGALVGNSGMGFTLTNMGIVTERTSNMRAAAIFLGTMVPVLTWALVKGGIEFSRFIGSAMGDNIAAGAANTMATGNFSLNQGSMDSFTANKHSIAASGAWGMGFTSSDYSTGRQIDFGGSRLPVRNGQQTSLTNLDGISTAQQAVAGGGTSRGLTAGQGTSAGDAAGLTQAGGHSAATGDVSTSGTGTAVNGDGRIGAEASVTPAKPAAAGSNGVGPASVSALTNAATGGGALPPAYQTGGKEPGGRMLQPRANLGVGGAVSGGGSNGQMKTAQTGDQSSQIGNHSLNGARNLTENTNLGRTENANTSDAASSQRAQTLNSGASPFELAQVMRAQGYGADLFADFQRNTSASAAPYQPPPQTDLEKRTAGVTAPGVVAGEYAQRVSEVKDKQGDHDKEREALAAKAKADADKYRGLGLGAIDDAKEAIVAGQEPASRSALSRAVELEEKMRKEGAEAVKNGAKAVTEWAGDKWEKGQDVRRKLGGLPPKEGDAAPGPESRAPAGPASLLPPPVPHLPDQSAAARADAQAQALAAAAQAAQAPQAPQMPGQPENQVARLDAPFLGQPPTADQQQATFQAQLAHAEHQAQRVQAQVREADGVLASADGQPARDHMEIIRQAREITNSRLG